MQSRERKAQTMVAVLSDFFEGKISNLEILTVGCSTGIIDQYLAKHFKRVTGVDIDREAVHFASRSFRKENLSFFYCDGLHLSFDECSFDVVICSQVYEHVPSSQALMEEIWRVLRPGGVCYFAANNRLRWMEPHYHLPLLSVLPQSWANRYLQMAGKGNIYYEKHLSYWGLKRLVKDFILNDYTRRAILEPRKYGTEYFVSTNRLARPMIQVATSLFSWAIPGYLWVIQKPPFLHPTSE